MAKYLSDTCLIETVHIILYIFSPTEFVHLFSLKFIKHFVDMDYQRFYVAANSVGGSMKLAPYLLAFSFLSFSSASANLVLRPQDNLDNNSSIARKDGGGKHHDHSGRGHHHGSRHHGGHSGWHHEGRHHGHYGWDRNYHHNRYGYSYYNYPYFGYWGNYDLNNYNWTSYPYGGATYYYYSNPSGYYDYYQ